MTTVSGPPVAAALSNQEFSKDDFRPALGLIRLAESGFAAAAYAAAGMLTHDSVRLASAIVPSLLIGLPVGTILVRRVDQDIFRRACVSFNAWVVVFGLTAVARDLHLIGDVWGYAIWATVVAADILRLGRFFRPTVPPLTSRVDANAA
jgi:hypothetical protein